MKPVLFITGVCTVFAGCVQGQSILGKHPADKVLPQFYQQNGNANTALQGINQATGTLDPARVPGLDASRITSGTFDAARLPARTEGIGTVTGGLTSHAEGYGSSASLGANHAEGNTTTASADGGAVLSAWRARCALNILERSATR